MDVFQRLKELLLMFVYILQQLPLSRNPWTDIFVIVPIVVVLIAISEILIPRIVAIVLRTRPVIVIIK